MKRNVKVCQKACNSVQVTPVGKSCQQAATIADTDADERKYMGGNIYGRKYLGGKAKFLAKWHTCVHTLIDYSFVKNKQQYNTQHH